MMKRNALGALQPSKEGFCQDLCCYKCYKELGISNCLHALFAYAKLTVDGVQGIAREYWKVSFSDTRAVFEKYLRFPEHSTILLILFQPN